MRGTGISVVRHTAEISVPLTTEISVKRNAKTDETICNSVSLLRIVLVFLKQMLSALFILGKLIAANDKCSDCSDHLK